MRTNIQRVIQVHGLVAVVSGVYLRTVHGRNPEDFVLQEALSVARRRAVRGRQIFGGTIYAFVGTAMERLPKSLPNVDATSSTLSSPPYSTGKQVCTSSSNDMGR